MQHSESEAFYRSSSSNLCRSPNVDILHVHLFISLSCMCEYALQYPVMKQK